MEPDSQWDFQDRMLSLGLARVSEAAAIAAARQIGRGDQKLADQVAVDAMRTQLNMLAIEFEQHWVETFQPKQVCLNQASCPIPS